jgi:hypothetical protein
VEVTVADRDGGVTLAATALTVTLNDTSCWICATAPTHMCLECGVVNGSSGRGHTAIAAGCTKGIEAGVLSAQERRRTCATLDGVDKGIEAFTGHVGFGRVLK